MFQTVCESDGEEGGGDRRIHEKKDEYPLCFPYPLLKRDTVIPSMSVREGSQQKLTSSSLHIKR
jgi:hypothetical protein